MTKFSVDLSIHEKGVKAAPFSIDTDLDGKMTLEDLFRWTKQALIQISYEVWNEEKAKGFDKEAVLLVDNRRNKPVEAVHPLGRIKFVARVNFGPVLLEAYRGLLDRSKVLTGEYKSSHVVVYNGKQVADSLPALESWLRKNPSFAANDVIHLVNTQPYARRLELLGVSSSGTQRRLRKRVKNKKVIGHFKRPNGAYQLTYRQLRRKYSGNVIIRFTFMQGSQLGLAGSFKTGKPGSKGRPYLYPAMIFRLTPRGLLDVQ